MKTSTTTTFYSILFFLLFTQISWGQFGGGDPCGTFPCSNGGTCSVDADGGYICDCPPFYSGPQCQDLQSYPVVLGLIAPVVNENDTNVAIDDSINLWPIANVNVTTTFTITGGTLAIGTTNITFGGSGNQSANFTAVGTMVNLNLALDAATFTPTPNLSGINVAGIEIKVEYAINSSDTASVTFDIEAGTLATEDFNFENNITLYPNPSKDIINIKNTSKTVISTIEIIDVFGQTLLVSNYNNLEPLISLNLSNLSSGIYFAKISTEHYISTRKIIVN